MTPVSTNIKIDPELKEQAQSLFESMGLNLTSAVNIFLRQSVKEKAIPFRIGQPQLSNDVIEKLLDEAERNATSTTKRYTLNEVMTEAKDIINN